MIKNILRWVIGLFILLISFASSGIGIICGILSAVLIIPLSADYIYKKNNVSKTFKVILPIIFLIISCSMVKPVTPAKDKVLVSIFYTDNCTYCEYAIEYFESLNNVTLKKYLVSNEENEILFEKVYKSFNYTNETIGYPFMIINDKAYIGYSDEVKTAIRETIGKDYADGKSYDYVANIEKPKEDKPEPNNENNDISTDNTNSEIQTTESNTNQVNNNTNTNVHESNPTNNSSNTQVSNSTNNDVNNTPAPEPSNETPSTPEPTPTPQPEEKKFTISSIDGIGKNFYSLHQRAYCRLDSLEVTIEPAYTATMNVKLKYKMTLLDSVGNAKYCEASVKMYDTNNLLLRNQHIVINGLEIGEQGYNTSSFYTDSDDTTFRIVVGDY